MIYPSRFMAFLSIKWYSSITQFTGYMCVLTPPPFHGNRLCATTLAPVFSWLFCHSLWSLLPVLVFAKVDDALVGPNENRYSILWEIFQIIQNIYYFLNKTYFIDFHTISLLCWQWSKLAKNVPTSREGNAFVILSLRKCEYDFGVLGIKRISERRYSGEDQAKQCVSFHLCWNTCWLVALAKYTNYLKWFYWRKHPRLTPKPVCRQWCIIPSRKLARSDLWGCTLRINCLYCWHLLPLEGIEANH